MLTINMNVICGQSSLCVTKNRSHEPKHQGYWNSIAAVFAYSQASRAIKV